MSCLLIALCLLNQAPASPVLRLYPVDDTARDSSFRSYTGRLRSAVKARKAGALRKLVDEDVITGPSADDKGWVRFAAKWHPEDADSPMWDALSDMLTLGFIREQPSLFLSPYLVWRFPRNLNVETHLVVIRDKVALRASPSQDAPAAALLSFDIVLQLDPLEHAEALVQWVHVRTYDGKTGYLYSRDVLSPLMPRAQFGLRQGRWVLTALEGQDQ